MEHHATRLRTIQVTHIPGIFQTESYTRTVFGYAIPPLPENELEARVAHRLDRSGILHREAAPPVEAVIHEAALRMRFGGPKVAKAQLEHIQELSHLPHVSLRVIPFATDAYMGSGHASLYASGPVLQLDTVQIDSAHGFSLLHAAPHLAKYRTLFDNLTKEALDRSRTREFIHRVARDL